MSDTCEHCDGDNVSWQESVSDRRGDEQYQVLRGLCADCGARLRKDIESGLVLAFGPQTGRTEGDAVVDMREELGFAGTNHLFYCLDCDEEYQKPPKRHDDDHEIVTYPNPDAHGEGTLVAEAVGNLRQVHEDELSPCEEVHKEMGTVDEVLGIEPPAGWDEDDLIVRAECRAQFDDYREGLEHQRRTGHAVSVSIER